MDKVRAAGDEPAYLRLDSAFHEQFFANCGNRYFAEAYARIVPKVRRCARILRYDPITRGCLTKNISRSCTLSSVSVTKSSCLLSTSISNAPARPTPATSKISRRPDRRRQPGAAVSTRIAAMSHPPSRSCAKRLRHRAALVAIDGVSQSFGGVPAVVDMSLASGAGRECTPSSAKMAPANRP